MFSTKPPPAADLDHVAHSDPVVHENQEAGYQVLDQALGAESHGKPQNSCGCQNGSDVHAKLAQAHDQRHDHDADAHDEVYRGFQGLGPFAVVFLLITFLRDAPKHPRDHHPGDPEDDQGEHQDQHQPDAVSQQPLHDRLGQFGDLHIPSRLS